MISKSNNVLTLLYVSLMLPESRPNDLLSSDITSAKSSNDVVRSIENPLSYREKTGGIEQ